MFTGVYRVIKGFFCNICRDFPAICKYYRVFPADIAEKPLNHPVNPLLTYLTTLVNVISERPQEYTV